jgi:tetratricopeptide (TPR) repeat protein
MTDGFPDRLTQLRARWQADRSSRIFLQLAEEYRHLGRVQDALAVLDAGLEEHPGYLSALVAKGRCLLEVGDPEGARGVLERVVQQDATQMVANKLLVRAHLETGEPERARQRLELYSLLNDGDPEIEELHRRVVAMSRPPRAPDGPRSEESGEGPRMDRTGMPEGFAAGQAAPRLDAPAEIRTATAAAEGDLFDLEPAGAAHSLTAEDDLFGLGPPPAAERPAPAVAGTGSEPAAIPAVEPESAAGSPAAPVLAANAAPESAPGPETVPAPSSPAAAEIRPAAAPELAVPPPEAGSASRDPQRPLPRGDGDGSEPFPDLAPEHSHGLYLASLEAEQLFFFEAGAGAETPAAAAPLDVPPAAAALPLDVPLAAAAAEPAEVHTGAAEQRGPLATATLGELYRRQGHLEEAERIFREVAAREPGNAAAREALAQLAERGAAAEAPAAAGPAAGPLSADELPGPPAAARPLDAGLLLAGFSQPGASPVARKAYLLKSYLNRLRQARSPHVS